MNYVADIEKWKKHFLLMSEGKLRPNKGGQYVVNEQSGGANSDKPRIKFVTPVAQAVELAKSELKEEAVASGVYKSATTKRKYNKSGKASAKKRKEEVASGKMTTYNEVHGDNLALFEKPFTETGIQNKEWITYRPINQLTGGVGFRICHSGHFHHLR